MNDLLSNLAISLYKFCFGKLFLMFHSLKNLFSETENAQVVENFFPEKIIRDLLGSDHFLNLAQSDK